MAKRKIRLDQEDVHSRKRRQLNSEELQWKVVQRPKEAGLDEFEGMVMLEEVEDVEVVFEETENGRVAKFQVKESEVNMEEEEDEEWGGIQQSEPVQASTLNAVEDETPAIDEESCADSSAWDTFQLDPWLLKGIKEQGFKTPTQIQEQAIPQALDGRDVVGIAQTGSGKTLAFGLPILHKILSTSKPTASSSQKRELRALILTPTRELALQVSSHLNTLLDPILKASKDADGSSKLPPRVSVATLVGGMSAQKQKRILERGVDVLVATPGRLWDMMSEDDKLASQIRRLRFVVLDEADRMIEQGHYQELDSILRLTLRVPKISASDLPKDVEVPEVDEAEAPREDLQTFIFSATLSKQLQKNLKKFKRRTDQSRVTTLDELLLRLDFRDPSPQVIDISPEGGVVATLNESKIECLAKDKDIYLYYFLLRYPSRSIVFFSSIDSIRRLTPLLSSLDIAVFPLHSQMEQRQRLKNLDRFKSATHAVLLATDIAARGLDIVDVEHVIHYQIPRTADTYVHRNGRTARAGKGGFALMLCGPEERGVVKGLFSSLGRDEKAVPSFEVDHDILSKLRQRLEIAKQIDRAQHKLTKESYERKWIEDTAKELDVIIDSDDDHKPRDEKKDKKGTNAKIAALKAELKTLLSKPLMAKGVSPKFITSGSRPIAHDLINGTVHEAMIGVEVGGAEKALGEVNTKKRSSSSRRGRRKDTKGAKKEAKKT